MQPTITARGISTSWIDFALGLAAPGGLIRALPRPSSFFFSPTVLQAPSTDRPETLPHGRNLRVFYNASPKIRGALPPKNSGARNMQNFGRFWTTSDLIANISGTAEDIKNRPTVQTMAIAPAFNEKSPVNFGPLTAWNYVWVWTH